MTHLEQIIELAEHPERFTEEQMTELLSDEESLKMYLTVSEVSTCMESTAKSVPLKQRPMRLWWAAAGVAAVIVGGILWTTRPSVEPQKPATEMRVAEAVKEEPHEQAIEETPEVAAPVVKETLIAVAETPKARKRKAKRHIETAVTTEAPASEEVPVVTERTEHPILEYSYEQTVQDIRKRGERLISRVTAHNDIETN